MHILNPVFRLLEGDAGGAGGGGGGVGGVAAPPATGAPPAAGATTAIDLRQHMGDDGSFKPGWTKALGLSETYEKFTRPEAVVRSYASLESKMGANRIALPGPNATDQERRAFYEQIGAPKDPKGYDLKKPDKIGDRAVPDIAWSPERAQAFAKTAFDAGLTQEQINKVVNFSLQEALDMEDKMAATKAQIKNESEASLRKEWGNDYDKNLKAAALAAEKFGGKEVLEHEGIANDAALIRMLAKVGAAMGENPGKGVRQQAGSDNMSAADAKVEAQRLTAVMATKLKEDRQFKNSAEYAQMAERKSALFRIAFPE